MRAQRLPALALALLAASSAAALSVPALDVRDGFDRPDGCDVGNGWAEHEASPCALRVEGGRLTFYDAMGANRWGLAHRPMTLGPVAHDVLPLSAPVTVSFHVTGGASSGTGGRILHGFTLLDDGTGRGYGLLLGRTDSTWANSAIHRVDAGGTVDRLVPAAQLPAAFHLEATVAVDGSIAGTLTPPAGQAIPFSFGPHAPAARGDRLAVYMVQFHDANPRPTIDDVHFRVADGIPGGLGNLDG